MSRSSISSATLSIQRTLPVTDDLVPKRYERGIEVSDDRTNGHLMKMRSSDVRAREIYDLLSLSLCVLAVLGRRRSSNESIY